MENAPSAPAQAIFVNYRRADSGYAAGRIDERLAAAFGREAVFQDVDSIPRGGGFPEHIRRALDGCRVVLIVIGREQ